VVCATVSLTVGGSMNENNNRDELAAEDLIEEVSIDGMCGVY
jgi:mycofactocin precursor